MYAGFLVSAETKNQKGNESAADPGSAALLLAEFPPRFPSVSGEFATAPVALGVMRKAIQQPLLDLDLVLEASWIFGRGDVPAKPHLCLADRIENLELVPWSVWYRSEPVPSLRRCSGCSWRPPSEPDSSKISWLHRWVSVFCSLPSRNEREYVGSRHIQILPESLLTMCYLLQYYKENGSMSNSSVSTQQKTSCCRKNGSVAILFAYPVEKHILHIITLLTKNIFI